MIELLDDDDEDFLSQVEAAEANAKRRKIDAEGSYTAALRGSRSLQWQQSHFDNLDGEKKRRAFVPDNSPAPAAGGDACFKCGNLGHWARDCGGTGSGDGGNGHSDMPEKECPCGLGICLVLTANTEKNRGRKFYRCPVKEENGGCSFFEWCENSSGIFKSRGLPNYQSICSVPDLQCPCGAGSCLVLTAKTEKNIGQQFYRCPAKQAEGACGFFKWCNEASISPNGSVVSRTWNDASNQSSGGRSGTSCFKCGKDGHWARDCPKPSADPGADAGSRSASSGACYKCGKAGHWAKDCSSQNTTSGKKPSSFSSSSYGYSCK